MQNPTLVIVKVHVKAKVFVLPVSDTLLTLLTELLQCAMSISLLLMEVELVFSSSNRHLKQYRGSKNAPLALS